MKKKKKRVRWYWRRKKKLGNNNNEIIMLIRGIEIIYGLWYVDGRAWLKYKIIIRKYWIIAYDNLYLPILYYYCYMFCK